jgi:transcriptional regulator with XRE-family HTH domain
MPYADFIIELQRAGLSVRAFAELVGMNPNSISNYARSGDVPVHLGLICVLVAELHAHGVNYRESMARVGVAPKKPRGGAKQGRFGGDRQTSFLDLSEVPSNV